MGNTTSTTSAQVVTNAIAKAVVSNTNDCSAALDQSQNVDLSGSNKFLTISQKGALSSSCMQANATDQSLVQDIANQIAQDAAATSSSLLGVSLGDTSANAVAQVANNLNASAVSTAIQQCNASLQQSQNVSASGWNVGVKVEQGASLYNKCLQENSSTQKAAQSVVTDIDQKVSASSEDLLSAIQKYIMIAIIIIVAVIVLAIVMRIIRGRRERRQKSVQYMQYPQPVQPAQPVQPVQQNMQYPQSVQSVQPAQPVQQNMQPYVDSMGNAQQDYRVVPGTGDIYETTSGDVWRSSTGQWVPYAAQ
jgi:hypothetical protein